MTNPYNYDPLHVGRGDLLIQLLNDRHAIEDQEDQPKDGGNLDEEQQAVEDALAALLLDLGLAGRRIGSILDDELFEQGVGGGLVGRWGDLEQAACPAEGVEALLAGLTFFIGQQALELALTEFFGADFTGHRGNYTGKL